MKTRSFLTTCLLFLFAILFAIGCSNPVKQLLPKANSSTSNVSAETVQLGYSAWPGWYPWRITEEQKLFAGNNVAVKLKWFDSYIASMKSLAKEQTNANSQTLNDTISTISEGADQVIVLVNDNSTGNDKVIARSGINSIADLKGKKVAAEAGTVDHYLLLLGMKKAGLQPSDINFVPMDTGKAADAFVAGQVDAVGVFAPFTTKALKRLGSKELFSSKDFPGAISDHLVFSRKFVNEHPDRVQALINAWFETLNFIRRNPELAIEMQSKYANVSFEEYREYALGTRIFSVADNLKAFQPGNDATSLQFSAEQISNFLREVGLIKNQPDLSKLFDDRFIKAYADKVNSRLSRSS
jgi:NitT/TauT family transport system substrate-binding protein